MARILITGGDPESQATITALLVKSGYEWRHANAMSVPSVVRTWKPALLIIDVPNADFDGPAMVARVREECDPVGARPFIVVVTANTGVEARIAALRAGADDCLIKPIHAGEFEARLRSYATRIQQAAAVDEEEPLGQILAFYGTKGGVGTTTVAINTAIALRRTTHARVCLVDANLQFGDHRMFLDFGVDLPGIDDIISASAIEAEIVVHHLVHHDSEIDILLAPVAPESADIVTGEHLSAILTLLRARFDYIIVDLDRRIDDRTITVIDMADLLFLVMNADLSCLKNVRSLLKTLGSLDFQPDHIRLLLNRAGAATGIAVNEVTTALGRAVDYQIANDFRGAVSAINSGSVAHDDSAFGREFAALAVKIAGPVTPRPKTEKSGLHMPRLRARN